MSIAIFADKFSGTLSSNEVLDEIKKIFKYNNIKASFFPVTDGGEGSTEIFKQYGFKVEKAVMKKDFIGNWIPVEMLKIDKDIFFETSQLIGIDNTNQNSLSLNTSCLSKIIDDVDVLSMGGSRTNDAGIGLLSKLGIDFLINNEIVENPKPIDFLSISDINITDSFKKIEKKVLVDTNVSLLGDNNAFKIFGPQKGLVKKDIKFLEKNVERIYELLANKLNTSFDLNKASGGASGGLSFALSEVLGCEMISGSNYFLEKTKIKNKIINFDNAVLAEGKFDFSSLNGKVLGEILKLHNGDKYFIGGKFDYKDKDIFKKIFILGNKGLKNPKEELRNASYKLAKTIKTY